MSTTQDAAADNQGRRTQRETMPRWAKLALNVFDSFTFEAPGRRVLRVNWAVNTQKIATLVITVSLMAYYDNFSTGAWIYLSLHGIYGLCWLIKDFGFPDHSLENPISIQGAVGLFAGLMGLYWIIPWLFIARGVVPTGFELFVACSLFILGVVIMISADCQRHFQLKYRRGLIADGMFRYTRNPNYLGETMLYASFAFLAAHWLAWALWSYMLFLAFLPRMYRKDVSLSRHPGWAAYKAETGLLIPWAMLNGRALKDLIDGRDSVGAAERYRG